MQSITELNKKIFNKNFRFIFLIIFFFELISLSGHLMPQINTLGFFAILLLILIFSLKNLKYGILTALTELFIGGKGYLFFFNIAGVTISIRIAIWLIIMSVYLVKLLGKLIKEKNISFESFKKTELYLFIILFVFLAWGVINGFMNNTGWNNIFFDFNAWLFFAYIFPVIQVVKNNHNFTEEFLQRFFISTIWLCFKTLTLLFIFSHNLIGMIHEIYRWVRITGVGEITNMESGFIRIFFQSHLFVLIGFFVILFIFNNFNPKKKYFWIYFSLLTLFSSIIILSFSRSFWVGMFGSFLIYSIITIRKYNFKNFFKTSLVLLISLFFSIALIAGIIKFPYPDPNANFNLSQLTNRARNIKNESAVSSRYALLSPLLLEIKKTPIMGAGFGKTITYKSSDPRILEQTADGFYTTYAFEWGWLDIWLKLGILGTLFYLFMIGKIIKNGLSLNSWISLSLSIGLVFIVVTSIFSPYTNHPLGIGYIIMCKAIFISHKSGTRS